MQGPSTPAGGGSTVGGQSGRTLMARDGSLVTWPEGPKLLANTGAAPGCGPHACCRHSTVKAGDQDAAQA